jgi:AraC-like DNA-binding protein
MKPSYRVSQNQVGLTALCPVRSHPYSCSDGTEIEPHDHDYFEITLALDGTGLHRTPHYEAEVTRGTVVVMAPGAIHGFSRPQGLELVNVYYLAEWLLDDLSMLWRQPGLVATFLAPSLFKGMAVPRVPQGSLGEEALVSCLRELDDIRRMGARETPSLLYLRSALLKLLITLSEAFGEPEGAGMSAFRREIWMALEYVEQCVAQSEPFNLAGLARSAGLSSDHFSRTFHKATGQSPMEYYQRRRVQHACRLLLEASAGVTEVAKSLGFCDTAHFSKMFKQHQNCTPSEYRAKYGLKS